MLNLTKKRVKQAAETAHWPDLGSNPVEPKGGSDLFTSLHGDVRKLLVSGKSARIAGDAQAGGYQFSNTEEVGLLVRAQRNRLALSQSDLAKMAKVGRRLISELESGKASLEIGKVLAVCHVVGIDMRAQTSASLLVLREQPTKTA